MSCNKKQHLLVYGMVGDHRGGIETYLLKMNKNMDNIIFDYVIEEKECVHETEILSRGGIIYRIPSRNKFPLKNIIANFKLLMNLRERINIVYFNLSSLSWIFPVLIARLFRYRVFIHSHNADFIAANSSKGYRAVNYINKRWLHFMNVSRLTCSKPATEFMFMSSDKVEMIYNAINVERFAYNPDVRQKKRVELGIPDDIFLLGFVGRLQYQKNPLFLATIMNALKNEHNVRMIVIGDGDMRHVLESKLEEDKEGRVKLLGNRTDVNEFYQAMDLLVLPSFHEGLPYVIVEAQSAGLPCIVSDFVTKEVDFTRKVKFLQLESTARNWASEIMIMLSSENDRFAVKSQIAKSSFNIINEAKRLEDILLHSYN